MMSNRILAILAVCFLVTQVSFCDVWDDLAGYEYGDDPNPCEQAETLLQETPVKQYGAIEAKLIAVVASKNATQAGKAVGCRFLQQIGTEKCIAAVSGLLVDEVLSDYAGLVLERLKCAAADKALREALDKAPDKAKVGILGSLGERRDEGAVKAATKLATSGNPAVATAAIRALGKIGGGDAAQSLSSMKPAKQLVPVQMRAMAACARSVSGLEAVMLCRKILSGPSGPWQVAAIGELTNADARRASYLIGGAMKGDDLKLRRGVLQVIGETKGRALTEGMVGLLDELEGEGRAQLIGALGARGDESAMGGIARYLVSEDVVVRNAAIKAVGKLGDAGAVKPLLAAANVAESEKAAIQAIVSMRDDGVDGVLVDSLGVTIIREAAIKACIARGCTEAVGDLFKLMEDKDSDVRKDAWVGLAALADGEDIKSVMAIVVEVKDAKELAVAGVAIKEIYSRAQDRGKCFQVVADSYKAASKPLKLIILDLGAVVGDSTALKLEKSALDSGDSELYGRALRALAKWPNKSAADDLLEQAKSASEMIDRIVALRGYMRIASMDKAGLSGAERVKMLRTAMGLSQRIEEKKAVISGLQSVKSLESLEMLKKYINDPALGAEAQMSAANLIWELRKRHPAEAAALAAQLANSKNKAVADKAKRTLADLKK